MGIRGDIRKERWDSERYERGHKEGEVGLRWVLEET